MTETQKGARTVSHTALYVLLVVTLAISAFNMVQINSVTGRTQVISATGNVVAQATNERVAQQVVALDVLPKGVPPVYGEELGVSYDDVSANNPGKSDATIRKLGELDRSIQISGEQLERYIRITGEISCEYCCGAPSIIFTSDSGQYKAGDAACGCAHSYAMRGVAKYLITQHGNEFSDSQILEELGKWKTLFFPTQITQKAQILNDNNIELNYINLASNAYRGIEQGNDGGMVGGC